jgi:ficolin
LGNDRLSLLTNQDLYQLRIDLEDFDGDKRFAHYYSVRVANEVEKYQLIVGPYIKGDAGDSFSKINKTKFSTKDQNNAGVSISYAQKHNGAWWYNLPIESNLNGDYLRGLHPNDNRGVFWSKFKPVYYSLKRTEMKIRPIWFKP